MFNYCESMFECCNPTVYWLYDILPPKLKHCVCSEHTKETLCCLLLLYLFSSWRLHCCLFKFNSIVYLITNVNPLTNIFLSSLFRPHHKYCTTIDSIFLTIIIITLPIFWFSRENFLFHWSLPSNWLVLIIIY